MNIKVYSKFYKKKGAGVKIYKRRDRITRRLQKVLKRSEKIKVYKGKKNVKVYNIMYSVKRMHLLGEFISSKMQGPRIHNIARREAKKKRLKKLAQLAKNKQKKVN